MTLRFVILAFGLALGLSSANAAERLSNPDASAVLLLQYKYSKVAPPYEFLASSDNAVKSADEFHKPDLIKRIETGLRAKMASMEPVTEITVQLYSRFAEYDTQYGEYDFDINDGTYISYSVFGRQVRIALTNGTKAQVWKLPPKDAEDVLRKNRGDRLAALVLTLALMDSAPAVEGETLILNARILHYEVLTGFGSTRLGSVTVEDGR